MRVAILILAIIGSVVCLGIGACQTACAGCQGSCAAAASGISSSSPGGGAPSTRSANEMASALGTLAFANLCSGIGLVLQAILGLIGGIVAFSKLGSGEKAKKDAVLLSVAIGITVLAHLIGFILVLTIDENSLPDAHNQAFGFLIALVISVLLHGIALVMAFLAKPIELPQPIYQPPAGHPPAAV